MPRESISLLNIWNLGVVKQDLMLRYALRFMVFSSWKLNLLRRRGRSYHHPFPPSICEGRLFIKSHISRARRRPINLPWRLLLWRRAKPGFEKERERETDIHICKPSIFYADRDISACFNEHLLFSPLFAPRVMNVTRIRRWQKPPRTEMCVWTSTVWSFVIPKWQSEIFILS